jgi:hypothetical protein
MVMLPLSVPAENGPAMLNVALSPWSSMTEPLWNVMLAPDVSAESPPPGVSPLNMEVVASYQFADEKLPLGPPSQMYESANVICESTKGTVSPAMRISFIDSRSIFGRRDGPFFSYERNWGGTLLFQYLEPPLDLPTTD